MHEAVAVFGEKLSEKSGAVACGALINHYYANSGGWAEIDCDIEEGNAVFGRAKSALIAQNVSVASLGGKNYVRIGVEMHYGDFQP
ncbi:MAG: hypothetical protein NUV67_01330 [archaeon]|nr:hypothetical protein [archaeon]